ncbi:unnamed protein product [Blumeria hordei]|uniref:Uncharacterized protein n=1 Tax=Blumeria hordei TaxID=2867405 RepID=A0A383UXQ5_BLUHO|nr:unnamed protein product [Blumeria hordei]
MRFSSIAVIFQCANSFGTALAAFKGYHIDEGLKSFDCDGLVISEPDYRDQQYRASRSIENNVHPHQTTGDFMNAYLGNFSDGRWVIFLDESSRRFYLCNLDIPGTIEIADNKSQETSYVLVLDNLGRAVAIFTKLTVTETEMSGESSTGTKYEICGIVR